ncbi:RICIN domain-containing protein [Streptomyces zaomyceticus]|uniref:RICIN domain-containing protein n=1 Tax=Streptomyces zaomyceticus TaxID=68286 RepID=UPI00366A4C75
MARTGRRQGPVKGATPAADELAGFLREITAQLTVRELADRFGGGRTLWSEYRSGASTVPLGRLNAVVRDRFRDARGREAMLERARLLHAAALMARAVAEPEVSVREALVRAEAAAADAVLLVRVLLSIVQLLQGPFLAARTGADAGPAADGPDAPTAELPPMAMELPGAVIRTDDALARLAGVREAHAVARRLATEIEVWSVNGDTVADVRHLRALARLSCLLQQHGDEVAVLQWRVSAQVLGPYADELVPRAAPLLPATDRFTVSHRPAITDHLAPAITARGGDRAVRASGGRSTEGRFGRHAVVVAAAALVSLTLAAGAAGLVIGRGFAPVTGAAGAPPVVNATILLPPGATSTPGVPTAGPKPTTATSAPPPTTSASSGASGQPVGGTRTAPPSSAPASGRPAATPSASPGAGPADPVGAGDPAGHPAPPLPDGLFRLTDVGSRMCLSAPRGNDIPAAGMVQTTCAADTEQFWRLTPEHSDRAGTAYALRNRFSGLCLSVDAARTTDDAIVTQYVCGDDEGLFPDQLWTLRYRAAHRAWQLINRNSGKCVAIRPGGTDLEQVLQTSCADDPWMLWRP